MKLLGHLVDPALGLGLLVEPERIARRGRQLLFGQRVTERLPGQVIAGVERRIVLADECGNVTRVASRRVVQLLVDLSVVDVIGDAVLDVEGGGQIGGGVQRPDGGVSRRQGRYQ